MLLYIWFFICVGIIIGMIPIHFFSVEHQKFEEKYGKEKGSKITKTFAMITGWGFFMVLFVAWILPQPRFTIPIIPTIGIHIPILYLYIPIVHLLLTIPFIIFSCWGGIFGVKEVTLEVAETHQAKKVINTGIYARMRHPQYFGTIMAHVGFSILLSGLFSLIFTPLIIFHAYITSWKEEVELIKEFGKDYEDYKKRVPMLYPKLRK